MTGILTPFTAISIMLAVYGFNLLVRMIAPIYPDQRVFGKYIAFQLILVFVKLQPTVLQFLLMNAFNVCCLPYTIPMQRNSEYFEYFNNFIMLISTFISVVIQMLIIFEMMLLQIWFLFLYRKNPTKEISFESVIKE